MEDEPKAFLDPKVKSPEWVGQAAHLGGSSDYACEMYDGNIGFNRVA